MKNFLVKSLFEIKDADWNVKDRSNEIDMYKKYVECHDLSLDSFKRHLKGEWEYIYISGTFETIHRALYETFVKIYEVWSDHGPCNILYTDPDTMAIAPVEIWGRFDKFMMFNYSDPTCFYTKNGYNEKFEHFFNAGVRYFPASMSQETWQVGLDMLANWDYQDYNTEQIILNKMLWSQGLKLHEALIPKLAYQGQWLPRDDVWRQDLWNGCVINDSVILHLHSSRDIDQKLALMKKIAGQPV